MLAVGERKESRDQSLRLCLVFFLVGAGASVNLLAPVAIATGVDTAGVAAATARAFSPQCSVLWRGTVTKMGRGNCSWLCRWRDERCRAGQVAQLSAEVLKDLVINWVRLSSWLS
jgi:hypothetical protein